MNAHIWRYRDNTRNYPGYHLSADAAGCATLLAWLRSPNARPEFRLQPVTPEVLKVPNNQGGSAPFVSCTLFKLHVRPDADPGHFTFSEVSGRLSLECSQQQVERIIKGVEDIQRSEGDYCIGESDQQVLWFWWYPQRQGSSQSIQRTGASRFAQRQIERHQRPAPAADPLRSAK